MVRIRGGVFPVIKEPDYLVNGDYRVDKGAAPKMLNCLPHVQIIILSIWRVDYRIWQTSWVLNLNFCHHGFNSSMKNLYVPCLFSITKHSIILLNASFRFYKDL